MSLLFEGLILFWWESANQSLVEEDLTQKTTSKPHILHLLWILTMTELAMGGGAKGKLIDQPPVQYKAIIKYIVNKTLLWRLARAFYLMPKSWF
jgi:hypothetical protein